MPYFSECHNRQVALAGTQGKNIVAGSEGEVNSEEAKDVEYDDNSDEGIVGDGMETLMIRKSLMTPKEDDSSISLIINKYWNDECGLPTCHKLWRVMKIYACFGSS